jgi:cell division protein FtsW
MIFSTPNKKISSLLGANADPDEMDNPRHGSDRILLICVIILMVVGVLAGYSAIAYFAKSNHVTAFSLVSRHLIKLAIAFSALLIVSKIDYHALIKFSRAAMIFSWLALVIMMILGHNVFGARRALDIGGFSFQPSSFAAVALLVHVSVLLADKQEYIKDFKRAFMPIMFWVIITCGLIGIEDYSSAAVLLLMCLLLMFIGRISVIQLGGLVLIGMIGSFILITTSAERQSRIDQYISQITHIPAQKFNLSSGYQAQQADIAIARGKVFGVGMGESTQRGFLPASYNDFIFAIIAEEYGLAGSIGLIALFVLILFRGIAVIARNAPDTVGTLLAVACTLSVAMYGLVNAAVATGLFPVTGLPMPFVSYGGTSMLFSGIMIGLLLNISKHSTQKRSVFYA